MSVASFLTGMGRGDAETEAAIGRALDLLEGWYLGNDWYTDGDGRMFDHHLGWAMNLYPVLYARLRDDDELGTRFGSRPHDFLGTFTRTFDGNGSPLHQGRSLTYRFAAASSVALGAVTGHTPLSPGASRQVLSAGLRYFYDRGANAGDGVFSRGWHETYEPVVQAYSGPGSPYWLSKAVVALLAGPDDALWSVREEPVPVQGPAATTPIGPAGWLVQNTPNGLVRVLNHGSDHHRPGGPLDSAPDPLYSRLAYSTRTGPTSAHNVAENSIVLTHRGCASVRYHFEPLGTGPDWAASRHHPQFAGTELPQAQVVTVSVARGPREVRTHSFDAVPTGTPVSVTTQVRSRGLDVARPVLVSRFEALAGLDRADVMRTPAGTGYGSWALVPRLHGTADGLVVTALALSPTDPGPAPRVTTRG